MQNIEELIDELIKRAKQLDLPIQGLSRLAGLSKNTLKNYKKPNWSPTIETIKKLQDIVRDLESLTPEQLIARIDGENINAPKELRKKFPKKKTSTDETE